MEDIRKGLPAEWFVGLNILTADEVKHLPICTPVRIIGASRRGEKTTLLCTVVQSGNKKVLAYYDEWGLRVTRNIVERPRKVYAVKR